MSARTSSIARSWSTVSVNGNSASTSCCQGVSGAKAWPGVSARARYSATSSAAISPAAAFARAVVRCQSAPPIFESVGVSPPEYAVIASIWSVGR